MSLVSAHCVVLQSFPYGDTSRILRLLSPELGLRSVIAKGARRPRSRFGGLLEPFTEGEAHLYLKEGRDLHTLGGFDLLRSRQALGRDLVAFSGASLLAEIVLRTATEESNAPLFEAVVGALDALTEPASNAAVTALAAAWQIVSLLGYQPETGCCVRCGRPLGLDEASRFDVDAGGAACTGCRPAGRVVDPASRLQLGRMARGERPGDGEEMDWPLHRALLRAFLPTHLAHNQPLRSLDLFADLLR
ncbi:MAG TPA: DNA repair protein RecO [Longimicrobiaceae bacterium]|nr:DNA repair protein RecO [Longimicrobiaceae bacterium]